MNQQSSKQKLSIIIPCYNVEKYIDRCLHSILDQNVDPESYEVIVINDGSKDQTYERIKTYDGQYPNLKIVSRENRGLSATRNEGLRMATGDFVWYVDSDDQASEGSILHILDSFKQYPNADFLIFDDIHYFENTGKKEYVQSWAPRPLHRKENLYGKALDRRHADRLKSAICQLFVYKRSYLLEHQLFFLEGIWHEDDEIRMRAFFFAKEVRYIHFAHYIYTMMREGSITGATIRTFNPKSLLADEKTLENWNSFAKEHCHTSSDDQFVNTYKTSLYTDMIRSVLAPPDSEVYQEYLQHRKEWRQGLRKCFWSLHTLNPIAWLRYLSALYFPKYYDDISMTGIKRLLKVKK